MLASGSGTLAATLLAWYDANARALPWRTPPGGVGANPYRIWLSEIMLQQTAVAAVAPYFERFTARWPTVDALAAAPDAEIMIAWAGLGYYARARNLLACARAVVRDHNGRFPATEAELRALPGIGAYTAAAIAAIAHGRRAVVIDGNVERVVARLFAIEEPLPAARRALYARAASLTPDARAGDYAQGLMDLGATICRPRAPLCVVCPLASECEARRLGNPEAYPVKVARPVRLTRNSHAYILEHGGEVLLERRPPCGLLGGMRGFPAEPPAPADWRPAGRVRHVFTHFGLTLDILHAASRSKPEGLVVARRRPRLRRPPDLVPQGRRADLRVTPPFFGGHWFDRLDPVRSDEAQLAALVARPDAGLLRLKGLDPVLDDDGRLIFDPLDGGSDLLLLGMVDDAPSFARIAPVPPAAARSGNILALLAHLDARDAPLFAAARSVIDWHNRHGFCAQCGHATRVVRAGWGRSCEGCGADHFPRVDPVVIMLAEHEGQILLGRQPQYPARRYSALAGFIEPGESIEDAVARELWEEAGVRVTSVRYLASQPWPFPSSLMIGCIAEVAEKALAIDYTELDDAFWVSCEDVEAALAGDPHARFLAPPPQAIARDLIEAWLAGLSTAA